MNPDEDETREEHAGWLNAVAPLSGPDDAALARTLAKIKRDADAQAAPGKHRRKPSDVR